VGGHAGTSESGTAHLKRDRRARRDTTTRKDVKRKTSLGDERRKERPPPKTTGMDRLARREERKSEQPGMTAWWRNDRGKTSRRRGTISRYQRGCCISEKRLSQRDTPNRSLRLTSLTYCDRGQFKEGVWGILWSIRCMGYVRGEEGHWIQWLCGVRGCNGRVSWVGRKFLLEKRFSARIPDAGKEANQKPT